jgi:hypothetical protein
MTFELEMAEVHAEHDRIKAEMEKLRNEMKEKSKGFISKYCKSFFERNPMVAKIQWAQYTPYFNDGEPCEFSIGDIVFKLEGDENDYNYESSETYTDSYIEAQKEAIEDVKLFWENPLAYAEKLTKKYTWMNIDQARGRKPYYKIEDHEANIKTAEEFMKKYDSKSMENLDSDFKLLSNFISGIENDVLEAMFGNHAIVTIYNNGNVEVEEHEHD